MHADAKYDARRFILKAITLRKVPGEVAGKIEKKARESHVSLNKAVIQILEEGLGMGPGAKKKPLYHDLDHLAGSWSKPAADRFQKRLTGSRRIDPELWR